MPATSPRLCITVNVEAHSALKRLAVASRRPLASVIRELLEDAAPTVDQIASTIEALQTAQEASKSAIRQDLTEAASDLEPHLTGILGHLRAMTDLVRDPDDNLRVGVQALAQQGQGDRAPAGGTTPV
jgi:hypothetical protein